MATDPVLILKLTCEDCPGIVAAVATAIAEQLLPAAWSGWDVFASMVRAQADDQPSAAPTSPDDPSGTASAGRVPSAAASRARR